MTQGKLLIVANESSVRDSLAKWLREVGYEVATAESSGTALARIAEQVFDVALVDIQMQGGEGIELQRRLCETCSEMPVVVMTGSGPLETVIAALKNGAHSYVRKPFDRDEVASFVAKAISYRRTREENLRLKQTLAAMTRPTELIGQSSAMKRILEAVETVAPTDATVLLTGETGTGKGLVARTIHSASPRRLNPLVAVHCGVLGKAWLERELFGEESGSFSGARSSKKGKFEIAEGGTVFLDEIGDISLSTQPDLMRVLQEREIVRVGGNQIINVDFRMIAASSKNLERLIEDGRLRPDLYYRLKVFHIEMPSLRQRREDIPPLASHFRCAFAQAMGKPITGIAPAAMELLQQHDWPGNVRELENAVERAVMVAEGPELGRQDFALKANDSPGPGIGELRTLEYVERTHILQVLNACQGNQTHAADILGIDRVTLYHRLKKYGWKRRLVTSN